MNCVKLVLLTALFLIPSTGVAAPKKCTTPLEEPKKISAKSLRAIAEKSNEATHQEKLTADALKQQEQRKEAKRRRAAQHREIPAELANLKKALLEAAKAGQTSLKYTPISSESYDLPDGTRTYNFDIHGFFGHFSYTIPVDLKGYNAIVDSIYGFAQKQDLRIQGYVAKGDYISPLDDKSVEKAYWLEISW